MTGVTGKASYAPVAKRVMVTGGAGFLGNHLCDRLIEAGNVAHLLGRPGSALLPDDAPNRTVWISERQKSLNWPPKAPLREGLGKTIAYFDALLSERKG